MQLETFISETLNSIISGIKGSQDFASKSGAIINPVKHPTSTHTPNYHHTSGGVVNYTKIDFDIAVSAASEKDSSIGGGIKVLSVGISGDTKSKDKDETVSRISFSVDVVLPYSSRTT